MIIADGKSIMIPETCEVIDDLDDDGMWVQGWFHITDTMVSTYEQAKEAALQTES